MKRKKQKSQIDLEQCFRPKLKKNFGSYAQAIQKNEEIR